ncbi:MAG: flavin reductase family protein, partial [Paracoccaceae bacterium]
MTPPDTDKIALRQALGAFATGVTIVTTRAPESGEPVGFTANSFTSVSLEPPLLLVCLAHTAASYRMFCEAESFAVNVLAAEQQETAMLFATRGA